MSDDGKRTGRATPSRLRQTAGSPAVPQRAIRQPGRPTPRGVDGAGAAKALTLREAYRLLGPAGGDRVIHAGTAGRLRSQIAHRRQGQRPGPARRHRRRSRHRAGACARGGGRGAETKATEKPILPDPRLARRIAWILSGEVPRRSPGSVAEGNKTGPDVGESGRSRPCDPRRYLVLRIPPLRPNSSMNS